MKDKYNLLIQAIDRGTPGLSSYTIANVHINDLNDNEPIWDPLETSASIDEEQPAGTLVKELTISDSDSGVNAISTFTILSSTPANHFQLNQISDTIVRLETSQSINMDPMYPPM